MTGPRPFTRAQLRENAAFLKELRRTGNAREAARRMGVHRARFTKRRARDARFAAQWDAALALAHTALASGSSGRVEPHLVRRANGRLQLRRALLRQIDEQARQAFLAALSASANVRLAARAAGFSHATFYAHKRKDPAFARQWRLALEAGYERLETELIAGWSIDEAADQAWQTNDAPAIPPMSVSQALQLLYLHQKEARLLAEPWWIKRKRGESPEARSVRLSAMHAAWMEREREVYELAEAARREAAERDAGRHPPPPPALPDLAQMQGWSKASGKAPHDPGRALFGGWRLG